MKIAQTINNDFFTLGEKDYCNESSKKEKPSLDLNITAALFILYSIFSIFVLLTVSILFSLGIEIGLLPIVVTIMLSAVAVITTIILSYASAMTLE